MIVGLEKNVVTPPHNGSLASVEQQTCSVKIIPRSLTKKTNETQSLLGSTEPYASNMKNLLRNVKTRNKAD